MAEIFDIKTDFSQKFPIISIRGYLARDAGAQLVSQVEKLAGEHNVNFIFDLSECKVISSPGVAAIMSITFKVLDDYQGKVVLLGLDPFKIQVLKMSRVIPMAYAVSTLKEALDYLE